MKNVYVYYANEKTIAQVSAKKALHSLSFSHMGAEQKLSEGKVLLTNRAAFAARRKDLVNFIGEKEAAGL